MKTRTLFTMFLSLALVVAFTASAFATTTWSGSPIQTWGGHPSDAYPVWQFNTGTAISGSGLNLNMNVNMIGSWDSYADGSNTNPAEWDVFHVQVLQGSATGPVVLDWKSNNPAQNPLTMLFDNGGGKIPGTSDTLTTPVSLNIALPDLAPGVYFFKLIGEVTAGATVDNDYSNERWQLVDASVTPTPLPAAVWMLGSGLLGFMGFKRTRKNAA